MACARRAPAAPRLAERSHTRPRRPWRPHHAALLLTCSWPHARWPNGRSHARCPGGVRAAHRQPEAGPAQNAGLRGLRQPQHGGCHVLRHPNHFFWGPTPVNTVRVGVASIGVNQKSVSVPCRAAVLCQHRILGDWPNVPRCSIDTPGIESRCAVRPTPVARAPAHTMHCARRRGVCGQQRLARGRM